MRFRRRKNTHSLKKKNYFENVGSELELVIDRVLHGKPKGSHIETEECFKTRDRFSLLDLSHIFRTPLDYHEYQIPSR